MNLTLSADEYLLLCSDGLTNFCTDEKIVEIVNKTGVSIEEKTENLIKAANNSGGGDNITAILIKT